VHAFASEDAAQLNAPNLRRAGSRLDIGAFGNQQPTPFEFLLMRGVDPNNLSM
jgi:hypothetical protein